MKTVNRNAFPDASPGVKEPLCGWGFVWEHQHDVIPHEIQIKVPGATYTVKASNEHTAIEAVKVVTK